MGPGCFCIKFKTYDIKWHFSRENMSEWLTPNYQLHFFPEVLEVPCQPIKILLATRTSDNNYQVQCRCERQTIKHCNKACDEIVRFSKNKKHIGKLSSCPGAYRAQGHHASLGMLCTACFFMFEHQFCWTYQYNKYMFNFIDIYSFIHVSGSVGMGIALRGSLSCGPGNKGLMGLIYNKKK